MSGYNPFWIYEEMLERDYLNRIEEEEKKFTASLKYKTDKELENLLRDAEESYDSRMRTKIIEEKNRRMRDE